MTEPIDYEMVIVDLEGKRVAINAAIDTIIQNMRFVLGAVNSLTQVGQPVGASSGVPSPAQPVVAHESVTPAAFFGLNIAEAAIRYLQIVKRQQSTREIAEALEAAGYHHTSQNFINTVNTALYRRERVEQDVIKIGRAWALAEWYPGRRKRQVLESILPDAPHGGATNEE